MLGFHFDIEEEMLIFEADINPLIANITKWSNTLKQFVCTLTTNCLSVFDHFVGFVLKGLRTFLTRYDICLILFCSTISRNFDH